MSATGICGTPSVWRHWPGPGSWDRSSDRGVILSSCTSTSEKKLFFTSLFTMRYLIFLTLASLHLFVNGDRYIEKQNGEYNLLADLEDVSLIVFYDGVSSDVCLDLRLAFFCLFFFLVWLQLRLFWFDGQAWRRHLYKWILHYAA